MGADHRTFVRQHTLLSCARLVPDIKLHLATEITPLWQASEAFLQAHDMPPPFWAFAWPGSEALARHVTEASGTGGGEAGPGFRGRQRAGRHCLRQAGAALVEAAEIDPFAAAAIALNAAENDCEITVLLDDVVDSPCRWDVILCGDVCYEAPMTRHIMPWLRRCAAQARGADGGSGPEIRSLRGPAGGALRGADQPGTGGFRQPLGRADAPGTERFWPTIDSDYIFICCIAGLRAWGARSVDHARP